MEKTQIPKREKLLKIANSYDELIAKIPLLMDESGEKNAFFEEKLGLSKPAISNKKHGKRDWKPTEVQLLLESLKKNTKPVEEYIDLLDNIDEFIKAKGKKKMFVFAQANISIMQTNIRKHNKENGYSAWETDEVRRVIEALFD